MSGGWTRMEVAFPMPVPTLAMRVLVQTTDYRRGAARHWAQWHPESFLMVFRSSVNVRGEDLAVQAANKAQAFWAGRWEGRMAGVPDPREDVEYRLCWAWPHDTEVEL